jgi:amphiphysin
MTTQWVSIYSAIPGDPNPQNASRLKSYYETPESTLDAIGDYGTVLADVKETLLPVLSGIEGRVVQPGLDMKKALEAIQKLVKKRNHKKLDYDRHTQSVEKLRNKKDKTEKDYVALEKLENELELATQVYIHLTRVKLIKILGISNA